MSIEIVFFPIEHGDFPELCKRLPEGTVQDPTIKQHLQRVDSPKKSPKTDVQHIQRLLSG